MFLFANCKLITSNFLEITFRSSVIDSVTVSPSNTLTEVSNSSANVINISESGTDKPFSHFDTVCLTMFSLIASSSCDSPFDFLILLRLLLNIIFSSLILIIQLYIQKSHCHKQHILTSDYLRTFRRQIPIYLYYHTTTPKNFCTFFT